MKLSLNVRANRETSKLVQIGWDAVPGANMYSLYIVDITEKRFTKSRRFPMNGTATMCQIPTWFLSPGHEYAVEVSALKSGAWNDSYPDGLCANVLALGKIRFNTELTPKELHMLMSRAEITSGGHMKPCHWFYWNSSREYFDRIRAVKQNVMEVYIKDNNGDPASGTLLLCECGCLQSSRLLVIFWSHKAVGPSRADVRWNAKPLFYWLLLHEESPLCYARHDQVEIRSRPLLPGKTDPNRSRK